VPGQSLKPELITQNRLSATFEQNSFQNIRSIGGRDQNNHEKMVAGRL